MCELRLFFLGYGVEFYLGKERFIPKKEEKNALSPENIKIFPVSKSNVSRETIKVFGGAEHDKDIEDIKKAEEEDLDNLPEQPI